MTINPLSIVMATGSYEFLMIWVERDGGRAISFTHFFESLNGTKKYDTVVRVYSIISHLPLSFPILYFASL